MKQEVVHKEVLSSHTQMSLTSDPAKRSDAPHFLLQPRSQIVDEGQNVMFTCEVAGEPSPEVEWLKDNMTVSGLFTQEALFSSGDKVWNQTA